MRQWLVKLKNYLFILIYIIVICTKMCFLIEFLNHNNLNLTVSTLEYANKETVGVQHLIYACILSCPSARVSFLGYRQ